MNARNERTTHPRKSARRVRAGVRREERANRTDQEQLDRLLEQGHGDCKEAQRLAARIDKEVAK